MTTGLLEKQSTGGATARVGFEYQDAYVLQNLPKWLAQGAFSHVVSEAIGDFEVCYFGPAGNVRRVVYEAKNHVLTAPPFWDEIARFKAVQDASPTEVVRSVLVCKGYNTVIAPLLAKVERLRGVGSSYQADSPFLAAGRQEVLDWSIPRGDGAELVEFLLDHVDVITYSGEEADSSFVGELPKHLASVDLSGKQAVLLRDRCKELVAQSCLGPVYRKDIEGALCDVLGAGSASWLSTPTNVRLLTGAVPYWELGLNVSAFNGENRAMLSQTDWSELAGNATEIGEFIKRASLRRSLLLDGKQRMSTACLLGHSFGATRGFVLQVEHNMLSYRTDIHDRAGGSFFTSAVTPGEALAKEGVVCIGFPTSVGVDLASVEGGKLQHLPHLTLESTRVVDSIGALNLAVSEAKTALVQFRAETGLDKIHLIVKAPSVFAMVLGHRLNGVCSVQLYDWVDARYARTGLMK